MYGGFPCTIGVIETGEEVTFDVNYTVPIGYAGPDPIVNTAAVRSDVPDPDPSNNDDRSSTAVDHDAEADLAVVKTGPPSAAAGSSVTYHLTVTNNGPDDALGVSLTDPTPAGLVFGSATAPCAGGFPCALGNVNAGGSVEVSVTFTIPGGYAGGDISNTATVTSTTDDSVAGNNSGNATTPIGADTVDLSVEKTGPAMVVKGNDVTYQITVTNNGPATATGVSLADPTPSGLSFVTADAPCGSGFPCSLSNLTAGGSATVNVTFHVPGGYAGAGPIVNTATVSANEPEADSSNNTDSAATGADAEAADLAVVKRGPATAVPGEKVTFQIVVTNNGPGTATGIQLADTTPSGLTFDSASTPCVGGFPCTLPNLVSGSSITVSVTYQIPAGYTGADPIVNTATVSANEPDADTTNNTSDASVSIDRISDLSITKSDSATEAVPGNGITYTIVVTNNGPSNVTGATVSDTMPASLSSVTWTCSASSGSSCSASGSGNISDTVNLLASGTATYTVSATVSASATGTLSNTATVAVPSGTTDPTPGNNSATDTDTLTPRADLSITKSDSATEAVPGNGITYTIVVTNNGPSNVTGATVSDTMPASLTSVTWTCTASSGSSCSASGSGNISDTVNLLASGTATYTVSATVSASATGSLSNTATVCGSVRNNRPDAREQQRNGY